MLTAMWIAIGGAAGSLARYGVAGVLNGERHPWGTVTVNIVGSLAIGVLIGFWGFGPEGDRQLAITVGLLGGFTTFSTFALDTINLWEQDQIGLAVGTVVASLAGGLIAVVAGLAAGRSLAG